ncbi:unnamed protein product [Paramecium pentaurelia]|uniref:Uncharacterized protein n=1 Tax=Paramecium pentaurelia TaxID=43138 RepID=A0A8S1WH72_9CILI|nr:unnamed protein product [Paramecium pentaurelia]
MINDFIKQLLMIKKLFYTFNFINLIQSNHLLQIRVLHFRKQNKAYYKLAQLYHTDIYSQKMLLKCSLKQIIFMRFYPIKEQYFTNLLEQKKNVQQLWSLRQYIEKQNFYKNKLIFKKIIKQIYFIHSNEENLKMN